MSRIRIAFFLQMNAAEAVRKRLLDAGIPAEVHDAPAVAWLWFVSHRMAGVRLEVPLRCSEPATRLLQQWNDGGDFPTGAIQCPECGSLHIDYPQFTEKSVLTNFLMGIAAACHLLERDYYCETCHCMWIKPRDDVSVPFRLPRVQGR